MMNKMTYKEAINEAIKALSEKEGCEEAIEKLNALIVQLDKRNSASKSDKPTKRQVENAELEERIFALISENEMTPTEVAEAVGEKVQRVTPRLVALVKAKRAVNEKHGKKNVYKAV